MSALAHDFGTHQVLVGVDLDIPAGASLAITGASGSGKSTLLHTLVGMQQPSEGRVWWGDQDCYALSLSARNRFLQQHVGWLSQAPLLDQRATARQNCLLPSAFRRIDACGDRSSELLQRVGIDHVADHPAQHLSGGQHVRCALARMLLHRPSLVIADEPTGTLDDATAQAVADTLFALAAEERFTLVIATHDRQLAARCDQHIRLQEGQPADVVATGMA